MYEFSDSQCRILKLIEKDALAMNHVAILKPSDIRDIQDAEEILQEFINDGLLSKFKPFGNDGQFSEEELVRIKNIYGASAREKILKESGGYLIYLTILLEEDWNYIAKSVKAHDRIKLHGGICYELKYDEHEGFMLRYYDYCEGYRRDILKVYDDTAMQAFIEKCFKSPNEIIRISDIKSGNVSKNISQLVSDLKLPKPIRDLFFHEITRKTTYFTPQVREKHIITYDSYSLEYLENSKKI